MTSLINDNHKERLSGKTLQKFEECSPLNYQSSVLGMIYEHEKAESRTILIK